MTDIDTAAAQRATLREITYTTESLKRHLESVKRDVERSLELMGNGLLVEGTRGHATFGPIGHQAPFDLASTSARLGTLLETAHRMGIDELEIQAAYEEGTK